jgi:hypothetical protein
MAVEAAANTGVGAIRAALDEAALAHWLAANVPG